MWNVCSNAHRSRRCPSKYNTIARFIQDPCILAVNLSPQQLTYYSNNVLTDNLGEQCKMVFWGQEGARSKTNSWQLFLSIHRVKYILHNLFKLQALSTLHCEHRPSLHLGWSLSMLSKLERTLLPIPSANVITNQSFPPWLSSFAPLYFRCVTSRCQRFPYIYI